MSSSIAERIRKVQDSLPESVKLIAVSKKVSVAAMREAYDAGVRDFGESRIQEAASKIDALQDLSGITWHFIGHLQSNKAKQALSYFQWIHSVDSLKLAQRLNLLAQELAVDPFICLQVKILPDPDKSGWTIQQLLDDLTELDRCKNLQIQGLMTIPPLGLDSSEILQVFNRTQQLMAEIGDRNLSNIKINQLSMGMSGDYQLAIECGATMIRLGTILFGERSV
ncbi:YggS family pyridoxal phosphate-dependent enzyme [Plectonema cf. radiosum LEGE 06105]|uniref:Pyridoxal phosphate homeostasis protein n=1 Tax=Plectonema cf. radiosum LEGE 06105 TaxID=945769 RepID=A0A8J7F7T8_9CYAN|nr:YggS family pyridoxal phosphate-dependent enzyme [Plectonema radiosum]MBE9216197.1 YggS family pyridoxal phosphate-dependent enzyme [Plectonema cf. radiosum LEGE 06105]